MRKLLIVTTALAALAASQAMAFPHGGLPANSNTTSTVVATRTSGLDTVTKTTTTTVTPQGKKVSVTVDRLISRDGVPKLKQPAEQTCEFSTGSHICD